MRTALIVLMLGFSAWACEPRTETPEGQEPSPEVGFPRVTFRCDEELDVPANEILAVTGGDTFENEAHDCQRLILPNHTFGPLVGVFPLDGAMSDDFDGGTILTLYNFDASGGDRDRYDFLNISHRPEAQWSCLSVDSFSPSDTDGVARVVQSGQRARVCLRRAGNPCGPSPPRTVLGAPRGVGEYARHRTDPLGPGLGPPLHRLQVRPPVV